MICLIAHSLTVPVPSLDEGGEWHWWSLYSCP